MSLRVLQASTRAAIACSTKRATFLIAPRAFSDVAKEDQAKAKALADEEALMTKLRDQQIADAERTSACHRLTGILYTLFLLTVSQVNNRNTVVF